ncbi:MAG: FIST N-terminal domain-containing protein, partial [Anaeromyxobacteraceae bacterium]
MRWGSTLSRAAGAADAFAEAADAVVAQLEGAAPDLLLAFASPHHAGGCDAVARLAAQRFPGALLVGCTGGGVIGGAREAEEGAALSLTAAALPGAALSPLRLDPQ